MKKTTTRESEMPSEQWMAENYGIKTDSYEVAIPVDEVNDREVELQNELSDWEMHEILHGLTDKQQQIVTDLKAEYVELTGWRW